MTSSEFGQYLKKDHKFDNRLNYITAISIIATALYFSIDFFLDGGGSNSLTNILGLLVLMVYMVGLGTYIIWLTYSQYRVHEYHSTKTKEEKLRILKIYLNKMWGHGGGEDHNNIFSYTYTKKLIYQEVNLIIYIDDNKLMFNTYDSRFYVFDFGLSRRAARNLRTFLKEHL